MKLMENLKFLVDQTDDCNEIGCNAMQFYAMQINLKLPNKKSSTKY